MLVPSGAVHQGRGAVLVTKIGAKALDARGEPARAAVHPNPRTTGELQLTLIEVGEGARSFPEPPLLIRVDEEPGCRVVKVSGIDPQRHQRVAAVDLEYADRVRTLESAIPESIANQRNDNQEHGSRDQSGRRHELSLRAHGRRCYRKGIGLCCRLDAAHPRLVPGTHRAGAAACVQIRQVCPVGVSPTGVRARGPVAWIAVRRETDWAEAYRLSRETQLGMTQVLIRDNPG